MPATIELTYLEVPRENKGRFTVSRSVCVPQIDDSFELTIHDSGEHSVQVELKGSSRALEDFGTFLVALGRLESDDPSPHEHFQIKGGSGPMELIVRRQ